MTAVCASGKVVKGALTSSHLTYYDMHEKLAEFVITYAQKAKLQGALPPLL